MQAQCPTCKNSSKVNAALVGRPFICPECRTTFTVAPVPRCPHCGEELSGAGAVLCLHCGFHLERGAVVAEVAAAPPAPVVKPPVLIRFLTALYDVAPGVFRPLNVVMFLLLVVIGVGIAGLAVLVLSFGLFFETLYLGSFAMVVYAQALAFLFLPQLHSLKTAFIEIEGEAWTAYLTLLFAPAVILIVGMFLAGRGQAVGG